MNILRRLGAAVAALLIQQTAPPQRRPAAAAKAPPEAAQRPKRTRAKPVQSREWRLAKGLGCPGDRSGRLGRLHMQSMRRAGRLTAT